MINFPIRNINPNFDEVLAVISGRKKSDRIHFGEILIDEEIKRFIIENLFREKYYFPVSILEPIDSFILKNTKHKNKIEESKKYYDQLIKFYYRMGYSFFADFRFMVDFESYNDVFKIGNDQKNNEFSRNERAWAQEDYGKIKNWQDFEKFPWENAKNLIEYYQEHLDFLSKLLPEGMKIAVVGSVLEEIMWWLLGYKGVLYSIYDNPKLLEAIFEKVGNLVLNVYKMALEFDCVGVIFHGDDLGFKTGTILSPDQLRKYFFPWLKKYASIAHSYNKQFWYHACGNKNEIMEDLIKECGIDALHSFEDNSCPVKEYKIKYGRRIGIIGGIDIDKLARLDEKSLRKYIRDILEVCLSNGRYLFGSGNSITNYIPIKNYLAMLDEGLKYY